MLLGFVAALLILVESPFSFSGYSSDLDSATCDGLRGPFVVADVGRVPAFESSMAFRNYKIEAILGTYENHDFRFFRGCIR